MAEEAVSRMQASQILEAYPDAALYPPGSAPGSPESEFFYRAGTVLTRDRDQKDVLGVLDDLRGLRRGDTVLSGAQPQGDQPVPGLTIIRLTFSGDTKGTGQPDEERDPGRPEAPRGAASLDEALLQYDALDEIERRLGRRKAGPEHLLSIAGVVGWCPADEPKLPLPGATQTPSASGLGPGGDGSGTVVAVVDCGLVPGLDPLDPWMAGVSGDPDPGAPVGGTIELYGGHGTFIASIVKAMAPAATVQVARCLRAAAAAYESDVVTELLPVLAGSPDVISLSAGTHTWNSSGALSFYVFVEQHLPEHPETILVAAAGNDGADWKFAPAEMDAVIGVGALNFDGNGLAEFSDFGSWVTVYAPGANLVQAFGIGSYIPQGPPEGLPVPFDGLAVWSGTSFSTPVVAGLIAAQMSLAGQSSQQAWDTLLELPSISSQPDVGLVLVPGQL